MRERTQPRERWASATVHRWVDAPLDADSEWDEQQAATRREAVAQIDLSGMVQRAVDTAIAEIPALIACHVAASSRPTKRMEVMTAVIARSSPRTRWGGAQSGKRCWHADWAANALVGRKPTAQTAAWPLIASEGVGNE